MQAYKLKGKIAQSGHLIITEPIKLAPGNVEVIILQPVPGVESSTVPETSSPAAKPKRKVQCRTEIFREWLENTEPVPPEFDPEQAKWEYLKEKHNL